MVRFLLLVIAVSALPISAQNIFVIESWEGTSGEEVQVDSAEALILGNVDPGTNLALRKPAVDQAGDPVNVTDGDSGRRSAWNTLIESAYNFFVQVDLEEPRLVDRVVVVPVSGNDTDFMKGYSIQTSLDNIVFKEQVINTRNLKNLIDTTFAPVVARYVRVQVKAIDRVHDVQVSELEVYGGGFRSAGSFTSPVADFGVGAAKNFGQVRWEGDVPEGTELTLQFRTGPTVTPNASWSDWTSPSSAAEGVLVELPEPRRYFQYQVNLTATDPGVTPRLTRLEVDYGDPLAAAIAGEVGRDDEGMAIPDTLPADEAPVGQVRHFLFRVQVDMGSGTGFDIMRLKMPNRAQVEQVAVDGAELAVNTDYTLTIDTTTVDIRFAQRIVADADVEVRFSTVLFDELNVFGGQAIDQDYPENPQEIEASASREEALAIFGDGLIDEVFDKGTLTVAPNPFSPDGDGRFDVVQFQYELAKLSVPRSVVLHLFNLTGRPVRRIELQQKSGTYVVEWDGRDDDDELVPPGLYLFQFDVDSGERVEFNGAIGVSY